MPNNDGTILKAIEGINNRLDGLQADVTGMKADITGIKQSQAQTNTTVGQIKTAVDAIAAGQTEIKETMATKADVQDLKATVMKKVNDHENRIIDLEKEAGIPHPHKH